MTGRARAPRLEKISFPTRWCVSRSPTCIFVDFSFIISLHVVMRPVQLSPVNYIIFKPCGMAMWSGWRLHDASSVMDVIDWKTRMADLQGIMSRLAEVDPTKNRGASFLSKLRCSTSSIFTAGSGAPFGGISIWMLWGQQKRYLWVNSMEFMLRQHDLKTDHCFFRARYWSWHALLLTCAETIHETTQETHHEAIVRVALELALEPEVMIFWGCFHGIWGIGL